MRWSDFMRRTRQGRSAGSSDFGQWLEAALLVILLLQVARLLWALVTPVGPFGDWRAREPVVVGADARAALFTGFDPFFRTSNAGNGAAQQVTSLPLKLFGIRVNEASGSGSAIIEDESGVQNSYAVGDEISPGVTLKAVEFDHVVIQRGSADETLYIDQSGSGEPVEGGEPALSGQPALPGGQPGAAVPASGAPMPAPPALGSLAPDSMLSAINMAPRNEGGRVTGIVLSSRQNPEIFAGAGFRPGDIVVQVNGRPVTSAGDIKQLQDSVRPGARISLMVERGAATVPISLILPENR